jgi:hypothetical protein
MQPGWLTEDHPSTWPYVPRNLTNSLATVARMMQCFEDEHQIELLV